MIASLKILSFLSCIFVLYFCPVFENTVWEYSLLPMLIVTHVEFENTVYPPPPYLHGSLYQCCYQYPSHQHQTGLTKPPNICWHQKFWFINFTLIPPSHPRPIPRRLVGNSCQLIGARWQLAIRPPPSSDLFRPPSDLFQPSRCLVSNERGLSCVHHRTPTTQQSPPVCSFIALAAIGRNFVAFSGEGRMGWWNIYY